MFARGAARAEKPCTYCNKCLVNAVENPLGCYESRALRSRDEMVRQIMSVFDAAAVLRRCIAMRRLRLISLAAARALSCSCARSRSGRRPLPDSDVVSRHRRALQVRLDRHRGARRPAVLDLERAADGLRGQAAEAAGRRLGAASGSARQDDQRHRAPDRHVVQAGPSRARRAQLRHVPRRHRSRDAHEPAPDRVGHARQPDGPAGLREFPDRLRQRSALRLLDADGGHPQGEPGHRRGSIA